MSRVKGHSALHEGLVETRFNQADTLVTVFNYVKIAFTVFDDHSRLISINDHFREMFKLPPELANPGTPLRAIQQFAVKLFISDDAGHRGLLKQWREELYTGLPSKAHGKLLDGRTICRT